MEDRLNLQEIGRFPITVAAVGFSGRSTCSSTDRAIAKKTFSE